MARAWVTPAELVVLSAIWGGSFLFMRVAAPEFGPLPLVLMRLGLGALILLPFLLREWRVIARGYWVLLFIVSLINSAIPFVLFAWAAERSPAGVIAIANSTTSLFTALIAFVAFGERIGRVRAIALFAGFAGVVVLAGGRTAGMSVAEGAVAGMLAAACYGLAALLIKRHFSELPPVAVAASTLLIAAIPVTPLAVAAWPSASISMPAWVSAILLGVLCTGVAYGLYFRLIRRIGASRAVMVTYLVPLFAVLWAWLLLDEPFTVRMAVAAALILGSVALSQHGAKTAAAQPDAQVIRKDTA